MIIMGFALKKLPIHGHAAIIFAAFFTNKVECLNLLNAEQMFQNRLFTIGMYCFFHSVVIG
ncbi:hypothetical protein DRW42_13965 [Pedobacter miscanthi]|uniref:Uncharacterized protein n=1 Tax=Pedobacter miscanthi TaxID=2259170 RepID=A0A366KYQ2_9SPHI|nr:hypothetical protein DRW42_13965 [Pedobacter miscanthi]